MGKKLNPRVSRKYKSKLFSLSLTIIFLAFLVLQFHFIYFNNIPNNKKSVNTTQKNALISDKLDSLSNNLSNSLNITFIGNLFTYPNNTFRGLELYQNSVYIADYFQHKVFQFSESGKLLLTINKTNPPQFFAHGLDIESNHIYTSDYIGNTIYKFDHNGTLISSLYLNPNGTTGGITALSVINNTFWVARYNSNILYSYSFNGTLLSTFKINYFIPTGLSKAGNLLFVSFTTDSNNIYVYQTNGTFLGFIPLPTSALEEGVYQIGPNDYYIVTGSWNNQPYTISKYEVHVYHNQFITSSDSAGSSSISIVPTNIQGAKSTSSSTSIFILSNVSNNTQLYIIIILIGVGIVALSVIAVQKNKQKYLSGHKYRSLGKKRPNHGPYSPSQNNLSVSPLSDKTMDLLQEMIDENSKK